MQLFRTIEETLLNLSSHAFRAFLAALGVVLGVGAVVGMMAISEGAKRESLDRIRAQGIDNIVIHSLKPTEGQQGNDDQAVSSIDAYGITNRDRTHIERTFENVRSVVPVRDMHKYVYANGRRTDIRVVATLPEFLGMTASGLADPRGRWLTDMDGDRRQGVCVIGRTAARTIFSFEDPLGQVLSIDGATFQVIGVMENRLGTRLAGTFDLNNLIYLHLETANALYGDLLMRINSRTSIEKTKVDVDFLYIKVLEVEQLTNTVARLRTYLRETHETLDYEVVVPFELLLQEAATQRIFTIVMASIAAISLLVGGIGIMNIMLANIYERTREIGTRRAVGAKKRDILGQFLLESVLLTTIGGGIGLGVGILIAKTVEFYAGMRTDVTLLSVAVSLAVAILTGISFGTYPAWKAANLDPIEALRHE